MINYSIVAIIFITSIVISFFIGKRKSRKEMEKILSSGTGKYGIIQKRTDWTDYFIEVEELETAGDLIKVRVIDVIIQEGSSYTRNTLLKKACFTEWVPKSNITWYDGNSQRLREDKLNKILGDK